MLATGATAEGRLLLAEEALAKLSEYLREQGLKQTQQRRLITEVFFDPGLRDDHPTVEDLYLRVRARDKRVGQATVYRTLKLLVDCGLAEPKRFGDNQTRYEPDDPGGHHDHLICEECGAIIEFEEERIEDLQQQVAGGFGFNLTDHRMVLYGRPSDGDCEAPNCKR